LPPPAQPTQALSDYAALPIHSRTSVRYAVWVGTWHDVDVGRPLAAPLEQCAQLLGVDLATVRELAAKVEPPGTLGCADYGQPTPVTTLARVKY
jgi:hypothetical protein